MDRSRNWCFTLNNYTEDDECKFVSYNGHKQIKYIIVGKEYGDKEHTPHLQGFVVFCNAKTFDQVKKFFDNDRIHVEKCKGNAKQNISYCSKDNDFFEYGEPPCQGKRTDISIVVERVKNHDPIDQIVMESTSYQAARHAELLFKYQPMPPCKKRIVKWYYGQTGTGKTRKAIEEADGNYYMAMRDLKWWDGYTGQKYIIIDDFRKDYCKFHELLRILDRYPYRVNIKGSSIWLQPTTEFIIITSCYPPDSVYNTREDIDQLLRRIDEKVEFRLP